jgi:glycosyltransferase involved in cell wall biosynthesis
MEGDTTQFSLTGGTVPDLSIVVLCYRSSEALLDVIEPLIKEISLESISVEILLVGNYDQGRSSDKTPLVVKDLARRYPSLVRAIVYPKEGMMGWDMRSGLDVSRGAVIAVIDGDGQMPTADILKCYRILIARGCDLVKTFRAQRHDGLWRMLLSSCYNIVFKLFFPGVKSRDVNSKPKVFSRELFEKLRLCSDDWFIDAEIMIEASRIGARIIEIETVFRRHENRRSFVSFVTVGEFILNMVRYRMRRREHFRK